MKFIQFNSYTFSQLFIDLTNCLLKHTSCTGCCFAMQNLIIRFFFPSLWSISSHPSMSMMHFTCSAHPHTTKLAGYIHSGAQHIDSNALLLVDVKNFFPRKLILPEEYFRISCIRIKHTIIYKNVPFLEPHEGNLSYTHVLVECFALIISAERCEHVRKPFSTAVLLISMSHFPRSPQIHVGCSRSITWKLTWILIQPLFQVSYCAVEQFLSYVQHIRQRSIFKQLNYYSYSEKNLLLYRSIRRENVRQLLLKAAILCTNVFVLRPTIICLFFFNGQQKHASG